MQPGLRISACGYWWGEGEMMMMERHDGERAADRRSVLHLWSAIREGISVSGSFKNKGREGVRKNYQL